MSISLEPMLHKRGNPSKQQTCEKWHISLVIKEMQIKMQWDITNHLPKQLKVKTQNKVFIEPYSSGGDINCYHNFKKLFGTVNDSWEYSFYDTAVYS